MVAVPYNIPLPVSPPPSPPRSDELALGESSTPKASGSSSALKVTHPTSLPTPDTSREEMHQPLSRSNSSKGKMPALNDFELIRVLGKGCAGRVLLVKHTDTSRVMAMKAISKRAVLANDELDHTIAEQGILRHFSSSELRSNAFVSRLYHSFGDKENFYLVMEFYPGGDLATQMEIHGILGPLRTRFYTCDIVAGLEALHREGILVRDLKPENILLNWHGHAVLADFGLSKNFGVRGDPVPVKLPPDYIEGKGTPPPYAGKGFGSYRNGELTWDRAYSFVGTQEYLAPEVIKRNHYTYAIDWWALGCIVCECLTGRVPFRGQSDESNAELYDRVINAPWDAMYRGDHPISYLKDRYRIDSMTYDFIDGLLQKEPMFRLTEPSVKQHAYFTNVDWDTVDKGDYQDPHQLPIDPVAEYNTKFFPKLCLEETPTVDMSGHDYGKEDDGEQSALNNDEIYESAQRKFAKELEAFEWSWDWEGGEEHVDHIEFVEAQREDEPEEVVEDARTVDHETTTSMDEETIAPAVADTSTVTGMQQRMESPAPSLRAAPSFTTRSLPSPTSERASVHLTPRSKAPSIAPSIALPPATEGSPDITMVAPALPEIDIEPLAEIPSLPSFDMCDVPPSGATLRIPSGPPSSGLSVSDIIAIPASVGVPLIIRRHRQQPSIDSFSHAARLSVDLNGTFGALGDEDWEQLDAEQIPELPNGTGSTSLLRSIGALGRRSSHALVRRRPHSTLRKITSGSESSLDGSYSPPRRPLAARGLENTKRAFGRIKLPKEDTTPTISARSSIRAPRPLDPNATLKRNSLVSALASKRTSRGDLQGLFRPKRKDSEPDDNHSRSSLSVSSSSVASSVPRVEFNRTPPIVWEDLVKAE